MSGVTDDWLLPPNVRQVTLPILLGLQWGSHRALDRRCGIVRRLLALAQQQKKPTFPSPSLTTANRGTERTQASPRLRFTPSCYQTMDTRLGTLGNFTIALLRPCSTWASSISSRSSGPQWTRASGSILLSPARPAIISRVFLFRLTRSSTRLEFEGRIEGLS